jgi:MFS transporter, DHA1 family, inner membrane transport protein
MMQSPPNEKAILFILACINFTHILDFMIMMPLGNQLMPFFDITPQAFTVLVSSYAISAGIASFISAFYVNNYDRKKVLLVGFCGFLVGTLACGFAQTYELLLLARMIAGLFGGLIGSQVLSIVSDIVPFERRGQAMGIVMGAFALSSIIGVPFAITLANKMSWHAPFIVIAILGFILVPIIVRYIPRVNEHIGRGGSEPRWQLLTNIWNDRKQRSALLFSGLMMMGHFLIIPFINPFLEFNVGYPRDFSPFVYLFGGVAALISSRVLGKVADKYGKWQTYKYCLIASLPLVYTVTHLRYLHPAITLSIFAIWFSMSTGRGISSQALISNVSPPATRGSFQSFVAFIGQLGMGLASLIAGVIITKDSSGALSGYGDLGLVSIFVLALTLVIGHRIFGREANMKSDLSSSIQQ